MAHEYHAVLWDFDGIIVDDRRALAPMVAEILTYLNEQKVLSGIVSTHDTDDIIECLTQFGIADYFVRVCGGVRHKRPALQSACRYLNVAPPQTLFVCNRFEDLRDSCSTGIITVFVGEGDSPHGAHADHHITELIQLKGLFEP